MQVTRNLPQVDQPRRGAMLVFILGLLTVILAMVVFTVDVAFMQLARTELSAAVDAAAKGAAGELARTNGDHLAAIDAGTNVAAMNMVAGAPLQLEAVDFEFGQAVQQADGTWEFNQGVTPYTSVRVTGEKSESKPSGPVNLFFAPLLGTNNFTPVAEAVASQFEQEIVLAIDRSHSMAFDETGLDWSYPAGIYNKDIDGNGYSNWVDWLLHPPHPQKSRWAKLRDAIMTFADTLDHVEMPPRVALVTWASYLGPTTTESLLTGGQTYPATSRDNILDLNRGQLRKVIMDRGKNRMLGGTNMGAGLQEAIAILDEQANPLTKKSIILMTDGQWNTGPHPVDLAQVAKTKHIVIHTVTFLDKADQSTMVEIAELTGGKHFHASNGTELEAIFRELAFTLPVALTH